MYQEDWIIRQIHGLAKMLAKLIFNKETPEYEVAEVAALSDADLLHSRLIRLLNEGRVNEAENLLFDKLDKSNQRYLEVAIDFYSRLNNLTDAKLQKYDFSREEIDEGLRSIAEMYGYSAL